MCVTAGSRTRRAGSGSWSYIGSNVTFMMGTGDGNQAAYQLRTEAMIDGSRRNREAISTTPRALQAHVVHLIWGNKLDNKRW